MKIQLSDHFDYKKLFRFTLPSIVMMIFTSVYGVVDGFFVSNFVGKTPFAAVNFIMPVLMIMGGMGFMFGTGGGALIAKTLGEGKREKANRIFSLLVYSAAALGIVLAVLGIAFMREIAALLGAEGQMLEDCVLYGRIVLSALPFLILQFAFQSFFVTAEKPGLGLASTLASGVTNIVLDALFMAVFKWGIAGAAVATAASQLVGGVFPLVYFAMPNKSILRLGKTALDGRELLSTCINGSSELMSNISMSVVNMLYNIQLNSYAGENGIAAYGVMMYVNLVFISVFIGYSVGVAPVVGYHYGAGDKAELKSLRKKSLCIILTSSAVMFALALLLSRPLADIFVGYDQALLDMTVHAFSIYSFSFLFAGVAIFGSSFFTALNNGLVSALISFLRTLVFQVLAVLIFPIIWELDGIWFSIVAAEVMALAVTAAFLGGMKNKYGY